MVVVTELVIELLGRVGDVETVTGCFKVDGVLAVITFLTVFLVGAVDTVSAELEPAFALAGVVVLVALVALAGVVALVGAVPFTVTALTEPVASPGNG